MIRKHIFFPLQRHSLLQTGLFSRKLDPSDQGYIRRDVLVEALTCYGDQMSRDQLSEILKQSNQDYQTDQYFDYRLV